MEKRMLFRNGASRVLLLVYAALFMAIGLTLFVNLIVGQKSWNMIKLIAWADSVIGITRDTLSEVVI